MIQSERGALRNVYVRIVKRKRSMTRDQQFQHSPRRKGEEMLPSTRKARSLSVGSLVLRSPTTSSRATFPFKPASAMAAMQEFNATNTPASSMVTVQNPRSHHATPDKINIGSGSDHDAYKLPSAFRSRPLGAALSPQHPRRCATFPIDLHNERQTSSPLPKVTDWFISGLGGTSISPFPNIENLTSSHKPKVTDWLIPGSGEKYTSFPSIEMLTSSTHSTLPDWFISGLGAKSEHVPQFPILIHLPTDGGCWWLREMAGIIVRRSKDIVQEGAVEIELVHSPSGEMELELVEEIPGNIDATEEVQVKVSITHKMDCIVSPKELNNDTTTTATTKHYSFNQKTKLQEKMKDLRAEIDQAKEMDPRKRHQMEKLLKRVEEAIVVMEHEKNETQCNESSLSTMDHIRKTTVAITGGALTVAGVVLIPCPVVPGCIVAYAGLMILASEFDSAKKALDVVKIPIKNWLADDESSEANTTNDGTYNSIWEELIGYNRDDHCCINEIDGQFMTMVETNRSNKKNVVVGNKNPLKPYLRKMLNLDSSVESGIAKRNDNTRNETKGDRVSVPDDSNHSKIGDKREPGTAIEIDLSGVVIDKSIAHAGRHGIECSIAPSAHDDDDVGKPIRLFSRENTVGSFSDKVVLDESIAHVGKHGIDLERLCSEGSIALDTLDDNTGDETLRLFSNQNVLGSSYGNTDDCLWVSFDSSKVSLEEECATPAVLQLRRNDCL